MSEIPRSGLKLGVVGKGGVGKTTVSGLLARTYSDYGRRVVAIDTDSNPNLGLSLGLSLEETEAVPVLPRSVLVGGVGQAADLLAQYGRPTPAGPVLLSAIKVAEAGAGCTCSGHATVRSLLSAALVDVDITLVDMEAGLEHLSRSGGTLAYADVLLVVCEPTRKSIVTAARTRALAVELGIPAVLGIGNKAADESDVHFFAEAFAANSMPLAGVLSRDPAVAATDRSRTNELVEISPALHAALGGVLDAVERTTPALA